MERTPRSPGETANTPRAGDRLLIVCPSCDHANPAGARYCNQCAMPVHFETCGRCEAINRRGAAKCHKCGCALRAAAKPVPSAEALPVKVAAASAALPEPRPEERVDLRAGSPADIATPAQHRRRAGILAASIALVVALVAVPSYVAKEHSESLDRMVDAVTRRGSVASDRSHATDALQPPVTVQSAELADGPGSSASAGDEAAPAAPRSEAIARREASPGNSPSSKKAPTTASGAGKRAQSSSSKSKPTRSKPAKSSRRTPVT